MKIDEICMKVDYHNTKELLQRCVFDFSDPFGSWGLGWRFFYFGLSHV